MASDYYRWDPRSWKDALSKKIRALGSDAFVVRAYLETGPETSALGLYPLAFPTMAHWTGLSIERCEEMVLALQAIDYCKWSAEHEVVWIPSQAATQIAEELNPKDKKVTWINREIKNIAALPFFDDFLALYAERFHVEHLRASHARERTAEERNDDAKKDPTPITSRTPHDASPFEGASKGLARGFEGEAETPSKPTATATPPTTTTATPARTRANGGGGPSPRTKLVVERLLTKRHASPAAVLDLRRDDEALSKAIDIFGGWTKWAEIEDNSLEDFDARGRMMRCYAQACSELEVTRGGGARSEREPERPHA